MGAPATPGWARSAVAWLSGPCCSLLAEIESNHAAASVVQGCVALQLRGCTVAGIATCIVAHGPFCFTEVAMRVGRGTFAGWWGFAAALALVTCARRQSLVAASEAASQCVELEEAAAHMDFCAPHVSWDTSSAANSSALDLDDAAASAYQAAAYMWGNSSLSAECLSFVPIYQCAVAFPACKGTQVGGVCHFVCKEFTRRCQGFLGPEECTDPGPVCSAGGAANPHWPVWVMLGLLVSAWSLVS